MINLWGKREENPKNKHKSGREGESVVDDTNTVNPEENAETLENSGKWTAKSVGSVTVFGKK